MLLRQGFLFKLKPNGRQARQMARFAGCCRFVYNKGLSWPKEQYENKTGKHPSYKNLSALLPEWKKDPEMLWLSECYSQCLQQSMKDLSRAYSNFFSGRTAFPVFHRKYGANDAFRYPQGFYIFSEKVFASHSLPELMSMDISSVLELTGKQKLIAQRLEVLKELGLGYLTLGEETPSLSGGEAQRLKLASEIDKPQAQSVFIFDEPTIGLHPLDIEILMQVFDRLIANHATVIVIERDLDIIRNADYIIDLGPGGGDAGGRIVATGTPTEIKAHPESVTGRYI